MSTPPAPRPRRILEKPTAEQPTAPRSRIVEASHWQRDKGAPVAVTDRVATETAAALVYNGISHVVMMVSPGDLEDFALGFSLSEGILETPDQLYDIECTPRDGGIEIALTISSERFALLKDQRRNLTGRTGCGLCGAESLAQALRPPGRVPHTLQITPLALQQAVESLTKFQPLQAETGATHGAAWCSVNGEIQLLREDVGRHNALDKLIGALNVKGRGPRGDGFALISSRASYEMVSKAAKLDMEILVAVSAPTSLAIDFALTAGLTLVGFARPGRHMVYTGAERISGAAP
ncbi:MAG: formate dehydrogenase accessory sulfurtransferase FdhD [Porticoccaceae bacterium]